VRTKRLYGLILALPLLVVNCSTPPSTAAVPAPAPLKAHMDMLQLMRAFPFPHANVLFDAQGTDPGGPEKSKSMSYSVYRWYDSDTYAGWAGVENSALALTEMAPMLLLPRACANGKQAPVDQADWQAAVQGLVRAGEAAHKAALTKNLETMTEVSETLANACAACHDKYRDVDLTGGQRCSVATE
jgi:hypothetical protein